MNLLDKLTDNALKNHPDWTQLRAVVEKELLHHDILRILSQNSLLNSLTFIGGTALRLCYGGVCLSEDLDFTGGENFTCAELVTLKETIESQLAEKYGLQVEVSEPVREVKNVSTWKVKIETKPEQRNLPAQRINIDICAVNSYEKQWRLLQNRYGVTMGTEGLVLQVQSLSEIFVDKLLAFVLRPNRIKYRDLWDIAWLHQQAIEARLTLIPPKLQERGVASQQFLADFYTRLKTLSTPQCGEGFAKEMKRFLPTKSTAQNEQLFLFIKQLLAELAEKLEKHLSL